MNEPEGLIFDRDKIIAMIVDLDEALEPKVTWTEDVDKMRKEAMARRIELLMKVRRGLKSHAGVQP